MKIVFQQLLFISVFSIFIFGCKKKKDSVTPTSTCTSCGGNSTTPTPTNPIVLPSSTTDTILHIQVKGSEVPVYISIPPNSISGDKSFPAMVLLHGSGGMWKDDNSSLGVMSEQNRDWKEIFNTNGIVGAYVDSYEPRGCIERVDEWKEAPAAFQISSQFVRPYDAYAALELLRSLVWPDGTPVVRTQDIGIMGFSDGATALAATLYDTQATPLGYEWTQKYDKEYTQADGIGVPAERPSTGGFACGVFYYGGSVGNSYWNGDPCTNPDNFIYRPYAPILYQLPEEDPLTENTLCVFDLLTEKGDPVFKYSYPNVGHGFDAADEGEEGYAESELARIRTIDWIKSYLHIY